MKKVLLLVAGLALSAVVIIGLYAEAADDAKKMTVKERNDTVVKAMENQKNDPFLHLEQHIGEEMTFAGIVRAASENNYNKGYISIFVTNYAMSAQELKQNKPGRLVTKSSEASGCSILVKSSKFNLNYIKKIQNEKRVYLFTGKPQMMDSVDFKDRPVKSAYLIVEKIKKD
jgi:hypothetical protein